MITRCAAAGLGVLIAVIAGRAMGPSGTAAAARASDPELPARLTDTGLYVAGRPGEIDPRNRPFSPQYPLWSDGAAKSRWVSLPEGRAIEESPDGTWRFPDGTRFWKEFRFGGRKVETRLLWKVSADRWLAASYLWNEDQSEALLAPDEGVSGVVEVAPGRRHSIPSRADCVTCHGSPRTAPLGFNPLQLSTDRDPNAPHREPLLDGMVTWKTLLDEGRLVPARRDPRAVPPRIRTGSALTRSVLGYLSTNCGSCHNRRGDVVAAVPPIGYQDVLMGAEEVVRRLIGRPTTWQVPGVPPGSSVLVDPVHPERSAILARMRSRSPSSQMPPLGTVVRDDEAIQLVERWIEEMALGLDRTP